MSDAPKNSGVRTFEMTVPVSHFIEGPFDDWPPQIQDGILAAMEKKSKEVEAPLAIALARCDIDYDLDEKDVGYFFVHVVLSEVVAAVPADVDPLALADPMNLLKH